jgi:hypothetical protein
MDKYEKTRDWPDEDSLDSILMILNDELSNEEKLQLIRECVGYTGRKAYA